MTITRWIQVPIKNIKQIEFSPHKKFPSSIKNKKHNSIINSTTDNRRKYINSSLDSFGIKLEDTHHLS